MKRTVVLCVAGLVLIATAVVAFGDLARPKPSPEAGKVIFHTGLEIVPDAKVYEARLQISQETLQRIREATANTSANPSMTQRIMASGPRTIMAGLFMFLAVSFAGVWLARSGQRRNHKIAAGLVLVVLAGGAEKPRDLVERPLRGGQPDALQRMPRELLEPALVGLLHLGGDGEPEHDREQRGERVRPRRAGPGHAEQGPPR